MTTTLAFGSTSIELPDQLTWPDEFTWRAVVQQQTYSLTGAQLIEQKAKQAGRPITLASAEQRAYVLRSVLEQLYAAAAIAGREMTLSLRGTDYPVIFDQATGAIDAASKSWDYADPQPGDWYAVTLRFLTVVAPTP